MTPNQRGALFMSASMAGFAVEDVLVKAAAREMPLAQAMLSAAAPMLIQKAIVHGDIEHGAMATGVVGGRITEIPTCQELVDRIMAEARARLAALGC